MLHTDTHPLRQTQGSALYVIRRLIILIHLFIQATVAFLGGGKEAAVRWRPGKEGEAEVELV